MKAARDFFSKEKQAKIMEAIARAELKTSGEIRVHIENHCKENVLDRAAFIFRKLNMHKTELRNGVLFYLAIDDRKFAVIGDGGINSTVPEGFWNEIKETMSNYFKEGKFTDGLSEGIRMAGEQLMEHFPYEKGDLNELSDEISFGKKD